MTRLQRRSSLSLLAMAIPLIVFLAVFNYLPMAGIVVAFKRFQIAKGLFGSPWAGFSNFEFFFSSQDAWRVTRNTIGYNVWFICLNMAVSVTFALILNELRSRAAVKTFQTIFFFPYFISWVVAGYMFYSFLNLRFGILNSWITAAGLQPISWYAEPRVWPAILSIAYLWKHVGYHCILYYAAVIAISPELYESASIDGASRWRMMVSITIPLLKPVMMIMLLLQLGKVFFADFGLFYYVPWNTGLLYPVTDVIDTYVFRSLRVVGNIGMSAAAGFYQSIMGFAMVLAANWVVRTVDRENAMF